MKRYTSPNNQKTVPVLAHDGTPLSPARPSRVRRWLETGKAVKEWRHGHFTVRLTKHLEEPKTPEMSLNIDPGAKVTGMVVATWNPNTETTSVAPFEVHHRSYSITQGMNARMAHRRSRRLRLRRRPTRFLNRTRKPDWLPPSLLSRLANITTTVRHIREIFPITKIIIETNRFDPRLLRDPRVEGADYQESERGRMQVRAYVLQRDKRTCQYQQKCRAGKNQRLEMDHIIPKSQGGATRIDNLITACHNCNKAKDNYSLEQFLAKEPDRLRRIKAQLKTSMSSATHMNQLIPLLLEAMRWTRLQVEETDAVNTAYTRNQLNIPKSHGNDALCLGQPARVNNLPERLTIIKSTGHGRRQMLWPPGKHGTPRYKTGPEGRNSPYRAYCRLPRSQQGFTTMPGHKLRQRRNKGITSGDLVSYTHPVDGQKMGYALLNDGKTRVGVTEGRTVKTNQVTLLARANGYRISRVANSPSK